MGFAKGGHCSPPGRVGIFVRHDTTSEPVRELVNRGTMNTQKITVEIDPSTMKATVTRAPERVVPIWEIDVRESTLSSRIDYVRADKVSDYSDGWLRFIVTHSDDTGELVAVYKADNVRRYVKVGVGAQG